jgi:regulator of nucleoside diphosphate kinase
MWIDIIRNDPGIIVDTVGSWRTDRLLLTEQDARRLRETVLRADRQPGDARDLLATALHTAVVVPPDRMPPDVVTMRSRLVLREVATGRPHDVAVVYPEEAHAADGRVSVLSPLGVALLGLAAGAVLATARDGRVAVLKVEAVRYQPEAAGELHL